MADGHWADDLRKLFACPEAVAWARSYPTLDAAWAACQDGSWMLWWAVHCVVRETALAAPAAAAVYDVAAVAAYVATGITFATVPPNTSDDTLQLCADIVRMHYPTPPRMNHE